MVKFDPLLLRRRCARSWAYYKRSPYHTNPNNGHAGAALVAKRQSAGNNQIAPAATSEVGKPPGTRSHTVDPPVIDASDGFRVERKGVLCRITLSRPEKGNSMAPGTLRGLAETYRNLANDPTCFHIVLAAEGKYFCTGMDFSGTTDRTSRQGDYYGLVRELFSAIEDSPQTTIVLVNGPAYGGGVGLTFACDVRIVTKQARWTLSEIKLGLQPAVISRFMAREWGFSFFREAMLSGRQVTPDELWRIGAVHAVVDDGPGLEKAAQDYASQLEACAPRSGGACKELVRLAWRDAGGSEQNGFIERQFLNMMLPGSEGEHGIGQFQQRQKQPVDWAAFWAEGQHST